MEKDQLFRRIFHICAPLFLIYYLLPDIFLFLPKHWWVLITLISILILETVRLAKKRVFFGMRDYERFQLSAYAWAGIGVTLAFLFFPPVFVACALFGIGWVDPLIGEMRHRKLMKYYPMLPLLFYFAIVFFILLALTDLFVPTIIVMAILGSISAVTVEFPRLPVDDDFLMLIVPLVVLTVSVDYLHAFGLA
jgi:hypothetical protein